MSTFGALQTAFSGLRAARAAIDLTGQNVANAGTEGYTRQRVTQSAVGSSAASSSVFRTGVNIGQGVRVDGIARLGDSILDNRVRATSSTAGYWSVTASAVSTVEASLREPGSGGLSATLSSFWASWQNLANSPGSAGQGSAVLVEAEQLASRIAAGYTEAAAGWSAERVAAVASVAFVNDAAAQVALLNDQIRRTAAGNGSTSELLDQRDLLVTRLSSLAGARVRDNGDSTVDVLVGGNALVSGTTSRTLTVAGASRLEDADGAPVRVDWSGGGTADIEGGELAGRLAVLAPADAGGSGGLWAEAGALHSRLADSIAAAVNALHRAGATPSGTTGTDFFALAAGVPAALGLSVLPSGVAGIAAGRPGMGGADGATADAIGALSGSAGGPDATWSAYVVQIGALARSTQQQATLSEQSLTTATTAQVSQAGVDLDEETASLLTYQYAYQGAARVMTAIDEMLDVLINKTGIVGR